MATCNNNGLTKFPTTVTYNGSSFYTISGTVELKGRKSEINMPPITSMDPLIPTVDTRNDYTNLGAIENSSKLSTSLSEPLVHFQDQHIHGFLNSAGSTNNHDDLIHLCGSALPELETVSQRSEIFEELLLRKSACQKRLETCVKRLRKVRLNSAALLSHIIASNLPHSSSSSSSVPSTVSRVFAEEETESSTDEDLTTDNNQPVPNSEDHWICTRSVLCSQWFWLLSEIERGEQSLQKMHAFRRSFLRRKMEEHPSTSRVNVGSCSRTTPCTSSLLRRQPYHDLASPKCFQLLSNLDPVLRCSCISNLTGPCIACCGSVSTGPVSPKSSDADLLETALPLVGHIHPKLSFPGDIQLSLRLESRLAAAPHMSFRGHKTTTHRLSTNNKPPLLRALEPGRLSRISDKPATSPGTGSLSPGHNSDNNKRIRKSQNYGQNTSSLSANENVECLQKSSVPQSVTSLSPDGQPTFQTQFK